MTEPAMFDIVILAITFLLGMVLSSLYFGALWLTLRHLADRPRPELFLLISLLLRLGLLLSGFYLILLAGHWQHLLAALAGFMVLRILLMHRIRAIKINTIEQKRTEITS